MSRRIRKDSTSKINTKGNYQLFRVDSAFRSNGDISDFRYPAHTDAKFKCMRLMSVEFPNTIYPISDSRMSNFLRVNQNGTLIDVNLDTGDYSSEEFRVELETQLNTAPLSNGSYTVTYDKNTAKLTITNVIPVDLQFSVSNDINRIMGFTPFDTGLLLSHTSSGVIDLSGPKYITFDINPLPSGPRIITGNGSTGLFTIPLKAPFGSIDFFEAEGLGYDLVSASNVKHTLKNIKVTVYDEYGRIPDLYLDWSMLFKLE